MNDEGVVTIAESTEAGDTRMYYVYREEFPEIYDLRAEKKSIAELAVRRIASLLQ